jgi:hypothetical protein
MCWRRPPVEQRGAEAVQGLVIVDIPQPVDASQTAEDVVSTALEQLGPSAGHAVASVA